MQEQSQAVEADDPDFQEVESSIDHDDDANIVDAEFKPEDGIGGAITAPTEFEPFSLTKERFVLSSINTRGEKHGDERVPALDLKFSATLSNSVLLKLHPDLRDALYVRDRQHDIEADYGRKLKFPLIGTIPYDLEIPRVKLRVHDCDSAENDVVLIDAKANKFRLTPMEGGSVGIAFRVQVSDYDTDVLAALARVLQQAVPISLACEAEEEQGDNFEQAEQLAKEPMSAARLAAEDMFASLPDDRTDTDAVIAAVTGAAEAGEQAHDAGIAAAEGEQAADEQPDAGNVMSIVRTRKKRAAAGAE